MDECRRETAPIRGALLASDLSGKGFPARSTIHTIGQDHSVFVRGWAGEGTGYGETSIGVLLPLGSDSVRSVVRAIVGAHRNPLARIETDSAFSLRGCLLIWNSEGVAYYHSATGPGAAGADSEVVHPPPRNGYLVSCAVRRHAVSRGTQLIALPLCLMYGLTPLVVDVKQDQRLRRAPTTASGKATVHVGRDTTPKPWIASVTAPSGGFENSVAAVNVQTANTTIGVTPSATSGNVQLSWARR